MQKTDLSIKNACLSAINRHTISPCNFESTVIYGRYLADKPVHHILVNVELIENELPIALTFFDDNWTLVTTRRILTNLDDELKQIFITEIETWDLKNFKDTSTSIILAQIIGRGSERIECLIESGRASMVMIYAIGTLIRMTNSK